jgi:hypothetical protein
MRPYLPRPHGCLQHESALSTCGSGGSILRIDPTNPAFDSETTESRANTALSTYSTAMKCCEYLQHGDTVL